MSPDDRIGGIALANASRVRAEADGTWTGLDGYYTGETLRLVRGRDGTVDHFDLGSFVFTREPYGPGSPLAARPDPERLAPLLADLPPEVIEPLFARSGRTAGPGIIGYRGSSDCRILIVSHNPKKHVNYLCALRCRGKEPGRNRPEGNQTAHARATT